MRDVPLDVARRRREAAADDDESPLGPPRRRAPSVRVAAAEVDDRRGGEARVALEELGAEEARSSFLIGLGVACQICFEIDFLDLTSRQ